MTLTWKKNGTLRGSDLATRITTAADGTFSYTLPPGLFKAPPIVLATVEATGPRDYWPAISPPTVTQVAGRVRRSRVLPSLSAIVGFDTGEAPGVVGVHLFIRSATA